MSPRFKSAVPVNAAATQRCEGEQARRMPQLASENGSATPVACVLHGIFETIVRMRESAEIDGMVLQRVTRSRVSPAPPKRLENKQKKFWLRRQSPANPSLDS